VDSLVEVGEQLGYPPSQTVHFHHRRAVMPVSLESLAPIFRPSVEGFMACYLDHSTGGLDHVVTEDCSFEGAFAGGILRGRKLIASHMQHTFRGVLSRGVVRYQTMVVAGSRVELGWELYCPDESGAKSTPGLSILDLNEDGLIHKITVQWDPRALQDWKRP
jgi:hypothetical protein